MESPTLYDLLLSDPRDLDVERMPFTGVKQQGIRALHIHTVFCFSHLKRTMLLRHNPSQTIFDNMESWRVILSNAARSSGELAELRYPTSGNIAMEIPTTAAQAITGPEAVIMMNALEEMTRQARIYYRLRISPDSDSSDVSGKGYLNYARKIAIRLGAALAAHPARAAQPSSARMIGKLTR